MELKKTQEILRRWNPLELESSIKVLEDAYDSYAHDILKVARVHKDPEVLAGYMSRLFRDKSTFIPSWNRAYNVPYAREIVTLLS